MDDEEQLRLARAWIAYTQFAAKNKKYDGEGYWASDKLSDMEREDPEGLWSAILLIHSLNEEGADPVVAGVLAAGPLENLLAYHGPQFIDRVETHARRNPKFAFVLCGVWQSLMSDEIWARVMKARNEHGWDVVLQKSLKVSR